MRNHAVHLPNGLSFTVSPVFGGVTFKSNDSKLSNPLLPPGWNIVLSTHRHGDKDVPAHPKTDEEEKLKERSTRFTAPTLCDDSLYISYIVSPPSSEYKPVSSHARQVAMMLWVTLWWYFHEPEPDNRLQTEASAKTPYGGKPKGEWRVKIKREGIFHGRNLVQKMERMGLVMSEDSSVGADPLDLTAWDNMFMSRRVFWQIDPRIFLFTMSPQSVPHHISGIHPVARGGTPDGEPSGYALGEGPYTPSEGPFASSSHLPTYFPPLPPQYTFTNGVRHPIRSKPPHQGDVCYIRYIPSVQQYLSFRVPYLHSAKGESAVHLSQGHTHSSSATSLDSEFMRAPSDLDLMHKWMNDPRVNAAWGEGGPIEHQENFLRQNLNSRHSFPVLGCWDGKPFGYFEIYWVKEDRLGRLIEGAGNYDRGIHLLIGEQEFRGAHRVAIWLSALVHYCWLADPRTETVMLEPRVDNEKVINYLQSAGFYKEGEVTFPHKQSALMKIRREHWECPAT